MGKNEFNVNNNRSGSIFRIKWFGLFVAMFWAFFVALALSNVLSPYFSQIISGLLTGITPLLIGIVIAFITYRLVDFTENVILKNAFKRSPYKFGIKRTISITLVVLIITGIIVVIFSILIPKIIVVVQELTVGGGDGWEQMVNNVVNDICNLLQNWFGADVNQESVKSVLNSLFETLRDTIFYIDGLMEISMSVVTGAFNFFIGLILAILILKDKEKISKFTRRFVYANFKKERADAMVVMTKNTNKILFDYVICKLIEFAILFVSLGIAYTILGLKFTWELALIIGLFNFIPYFGVYIGAIPSILITLIFNSVDMALYMAIATIIITTLEFNILIPIITGNKLKVSALLVTASIIIGGAMFGIMGMLLAPPIIAIISVIVMGNLELKENHMLYTMELNAERERQRKEEEERLKALKGKSTAKTVSAKKSSKTKTLAKNNSAIEKSDSKLTEKNSIANNSDNLSADFTTKDVEPNAVILDVEPKAKVLDNEPTTNMDSESKDFGSETNTLEISSSETKNLTGGAVQTKMELEKPKKAKSSKMISNSASNNLDEKSNTPKKLSDSTSTKPKTKTTKNVAKKSQD